VQADRKEILRYLGYGKSEADETTQQLIEECILEVERIASPKAVTKELPLKFTWINSEEKKEDNVEIDFGYFQTRSKHLFSNLKDCEQVIFFAATLGLGVDQLIKKYSKFVDG